MRVLLIDDHVMFRQGISLLLSDFDQSLQFAEAGTCEQALAQLHENSADLILLDLSMPGTQGLSALLQIRAEFPNIPLAVISGTPEATEGGPVPCSSHPKLTLPCSSRATAASLPGKPARRSRH